MISNEQSGPLWIDIGREEKPRLDRRRVVRVEALRLAIALSENTVEGVIADARQIEAYINEGVYGTFRPKETTP